MPTRLHRAAPLAAAALLAGCASTLSTMDTARTMAPGQFRANLATGVYVPAGATIRLATRGADLARKLIAEDRDPTVQELDQMFEAGLATAVLPIAPVTELQLRTGIVNNLDAGFRLATTGARLDLKFRFLHSQDDKDHASIGVGASRYFFSGPVFDALSFVKVDDFKRWDLEIPLLYSHEVNQIFRWYAGAKYIRSAFSMSEKLAKAQAVAAQNGSPDFFQTEEVMHFAGATAGIMVGYRHLYVALELTGGRVIAEPMIYSFETKTLQKRDLGGVTLYPAIGLVLEM